MTQELVKSIKERFAKANVQLQEKEIKSRLDLLINEFKVSQQEAVRTVVGFFRQQHGLKFEDIGGAQGSAQSYTVGEIPKEDNRWVSTHGKIIQLWEPGSEVIHQTGLIGDETGIVKFTIFAKNSDINVTESETYDFSNMVTSMWQGGLSLKANKNSKISVSSIKIENVSRKEDTVIGIIAAISQGSGLIKRCPECQRALVKGACMEHGKIEGTYDLRIKAVLAIFKEDRSIDLILNKKVTELLTGMTIETARELATEALDIGVITEVFQKMIVGKYFTVKGQQMPSNSMLVSEIVQFTLSEEQIKAAGSD